MDRERINEFRDLLNSLEGIINCMRIYKAQRASVHEHLCQLREMLDFEKSKLG